MLLHSLLFVVLGACHVQAKAVFASFMLVNSGSFDVARWTANIQLAQAAHIDAFCLNIAYGWPDNEKQIALAFTAASAAGFKLFFSFDYPGSVNSTWPPDSVRPLLETYSKSPAYYQYDQYGGMPLVSTFEGSGHAADWKIINPNASTYFFVPDYSSIGPGPALAAGGGRGVARGLASRAAAWPTGTSNITAIIDASYKELLLDDRPYMMPVSPWFFSNMPGFDRNWLWNSGDLWHQRWQVVVSLDFQPEFLQIISWNDFGESHYIGPLDETQYDAFAPGRGDAPYNYAEDMPHDGWREHLPYYIDLYKTGYANFTRESIVTWFRTSLGGACAFGSTTGGTVRQSQYENDPLLLMPDRLYFSVLLSSYAGLEVTYGGQNYSIKDWDQTPDGGVGVYHTSLAITTTSGPWTVNVVRDGAVIINYAVPQGVFDSCPKGITNWNAWVGSKQGNATVDGQTHRNITRAPCVEGWGPDPFAAVCNTTCMYGYCPSFACVCTKRSSDWNWPPDSTTSVGQSINHHGDKRYDDLCQVSCDMGTCPSDVCSSWMSRLNESESAGVSRPRPPGFGFYRAADMIWTNWRDMLTRWPF